MPSQSETDQGQMPRRRWKTKVRSGCLTCKARRIKCDEGKPQCQRCISSGRQCQGYVPIQTLVFDPDASAMERRAFDFFRNRTGPEMSGFYDASFWNRVVLQVAHASTPLRHCIVAVASLHESLQLDHGSRQLENEDFASKSIQFALKHYNKAIQSLRQLDGERPLEKETVLLACILFICYENMDGAYDRSLAHVRNGLNIIRSGTASVTERNSPRYTDNDVGDNIAKIFGRLQHNYSSLVKNVSVKVPVPQPLEDIPAPEIAPSFQTMHEARLYLDVILNWMLQTMHASFMSGESPRNEIFEAHDAQIARWRDAFDTLIRRSRHRQDMDFQRTGMGIWVHSEMAKILPRTLGSATELVYDQFEESFAHIVSRSRIALDMDHKDPQRRGRKTVFQFELGVIPALYFIASRCRNPSLRRQAIDLLIKSGHREGIWNGTIAGRIAERLTLIEEHGLPCIRGSMDIPEDRRVRLLSTDFDEHNGLNGIMTLRYIRSPYDPEFRPVRKDHSSWDATGAIHASNTDKSQFWNSIYCTTYASNTGKSR